MKPIHVVWAMISTSLAGTAVILLTLYASQISARGQDAASAELVASSLHYAVVIDAGSSGSRVHVYKYQPAPNPAYYPSVELPDEQLKITPGLSAYAPDGEGAGESLLPLIEFAKQQVPEALWSSTPIALLATAGLRLLPDSQSAAVLAYVRATLATSGLLFRDAWARILPGDLEGLYAWAAVNYASGTLQALAASSPTPSKTTVKPHRPAGAPPNGTTWGVFELGGASMQVTFLPDQVLPEFSRNLDLPGLRSVPLYTHSFLGYGLDVAFMRASMAAQSRDDSRDPCLPGGFKTESGIEGSGNLTECLEVASTLLPDVPCKYSACSINGEYLPKLSGVYLGMENFFFTSARMGLPEAALSTAQLSRAAGGFCAKSWEQLEKEFMRGPHPVPKEYLIKACFASAYVITVLRDAFHLGQDDKRVVFTNTVRAPDGAKREVNWALGALIAEVITSAHGTAGADAAAVGGGGSSGSISSTGSRKEGPKASGTKGSSATPAGSGSGPAAANKPSSSKGSSSSSSKSGASSKAKAGSSSGSSSGDDEERVPMSASLWVRQLLLVVAVAVMLAGAAFVWVHWDSMAGDAAASSSSSPGSRSSSSSGVAVAAELAGGLAGSKRDGSGGGSTWLEACMLRGVDAANVFLQRVHHVAASGPGVGYQSVVSADGVDVELAAGTGKALKI